MLEDGLGYPVRDDWIGRVIIGGVLGIFSFLIVPLVVLNGYLYRVLERTIEGDSVPPEFTDWGEMFARGVGVSVIAIAYAIVPVLVYVVIVSVFLGAGGLVGGDSGGVLAGLGVLSAVLLVPVLLFAYYVIPAAIANYASTGELGAAFDVAAITDVVFTADYLAAVLLPIVVGIVLWMVTVFLAITIVGLLFLPFLQFYGEVAIFRMFGTAFRNTQVR